MKKYISLFLALMMWVMVMPVGASYEEIYRETEVIHTEDGDIEIETVLTIYDTPFRASSRTASKSQNIKYDGSTIAKVTLTATFRYDGSSVSVTDTDSSHTTYDGWSYKNEDILTYGGTAKLSAKLTKLNYSDIPFNIAMICTADGTIS